MAGMPAEPGERLPGERVILGGATVVLSILPIGLLVAPAPLAVLVLRHGLASGIVAAILSGLFASILTLSPLILAQVLLALALGIALGEALRDALATRQVIAVGSVVVLVTTLLLMFLIQRVVGMSPIDIVATFWQEALKSAAGSDMASEAFVEAQLNAMRAMLPASLVLGSVGLTVVDYGLTRWLAQKLPGENEKVPPLPPFSRWRFPRWIAVLYIIGRIVEALFLARLVGIAQMAVINAVLILGFLVTVQGIAVGWFYLQQAKVSTALRWLIVFGVLLFLQPVASLLFLVAGVLDSWLDLRRVKRFDAEV